MSATRAMTWTLFWARELSPSDSGEGVLSRDAIVAEPSVQPSGQLA